MSRAGIQKLDQSGQVGNVIFDMPLTGRGGTAAVAPTIVGDNPKPFRKLRHNLPPCRVIGPGTVDQDERRPRPGLLVEKLDSVQ